MRPVSTIDRIVASSLLILIRHLPEGLLKTSRESITAPESDFHCDFFVEKRNDKNSCYVERYSYPSV